MTISDPSGGARVEAEGDGSSSSVAVPFSFWLGTDLQVIHSDSSGVDTWWDYGPDFSVTGGEGSLGGVTFTPSKLAAGEKLTILLADDADQAVSFSPGQIQTASLQKAVDKLASHLQAVKEHVSRAVGLGASTRSATPTLPEPSAGQQLGWNAAGTDLENKPTLSVGTVDDVLVGEPATVVLNADGSLDFEVPAGLTGSQGPTGGAGAMGPAGPTGATGAIGATGSAGTPGGPEGPAGPTGAEGATGPAGADGTDGVGAAAWTEILAETDPTGLHNKDVTDLSAYNEIMMVLRVTPESLNSRLVLTFSDDNGVTFETTGYHDGYQEAASRIQVTRTDLDTGDNFLMTIKIARLGTQMAVTGLSGDTASAASVSNALFANGNVVDALRISLWDNTFVTARNFSTDSTISVYGR
ncbi:MAG: hypothetical protein JKY34_07745 [Kordiimonadaceae bacterium]|nr:hypothetical protein [Kordiimonadaceae bacterium]